MLLFSLGRIIGLLWCFRGGRQYLGGGGDRNQRIFLSFINFSFCVFLERFNICYCLCCVFGGESFFLFVGWFWERNGEVVGRRGVLGFWEEVGLNEVGIFQFYGLNQFFVFGFDIRGFGGCCVVLVLFVIFSFVWVVFLG